MQSSTDRKGLIKGSMKVQWSWHLGIAHLCYSLSCSKNSLREQTG